MLPKAGEDTVNLFGEYCSCDFVTDILYKKLYNSKKIKVRSPSPFKDNKTERIETNNKTFCVGGTVGDFDCSSAVMRITNEDAEHIEKMKKIQKEFLISSQKYFGIASLEHFKLEDIYINAMNFEKNEMICGKIIDDLEKYLEF